ncbi:aminotransferase class IV [Rariglobus hedericola]|uniref:branched-chain-amino-acid transaminase n=1 Tax=Rariglobus hedericola TaxID=2597822 RepID=A0A556QMJ4_9BACT|nr:aminotransferase class IV [Rariglobus hedericola]TSJ77869.1 aminotransferase class IV [Rariglobus hedericola]
MTDASSQVILDGVLLPAASAFIPATSEGFLYGHGIFETVKITSGRPAFLAQHHARLTASARALDLRYTVSIETLRERLALVTTANTLTDGSVKIVLFARDETTTGELISTKANAYPLETYARGFRVNTVFTGERTGALSGHKTLNYLANIRAKRVAVAAGFDEPLFLTPAGIVIEGATSNIFTVRDGIAHTPSLASGPLPGIARAQVLALLGSARVREGLLTHSDLLHADEVFVTNALLGVMPVTQIDDRHLEIGPLTRSLKNLYHISETQSLS